MQIKVHRPQQPSQPHGNKHPSPQQKPLKMTLKEYLQSTNLKRRISSRSKSKTKKPASQNEPKLLQPPNVHQTIEYFKLNQEWKARKVFNSWISNLKELCREYIKKDSEFVEVIRLVEKIVDFVKTQIESIKKDNLILESFLVTEASYWPAEGSAYNHHETNNDKLSNYLKVMLNNNKDEQCNSPNKSQLINETGSPFQGQLPGAQLPQNSYKTSTQPKIRKNSHQISTKSDNKQQPSSSQVYGLISTQKQQHHLYSFKDRTLEQKRTHSLKRHHQLQHKINIQPFESSTHRECDRIEQQSQEENQDNYLDVDKCKQQDQYRDLGLLKIHSRTEEEVPRLSLMSRYDLNRNGGGGKEGWQRENIHEDCDQRKKTQIRDIQPINPSKFTDIQLSNLSTKSQISHHNPSNQPNSYNYQKEHQQTKPPLRERKQKAHQKFPNQRSEGFDMIVIDPKTSVNRVQSFQEEVQTSPIALRQSPHVISLETPSTFRRYNPGQNQTSQSKKEPEIKHSTTNPLNPYNANNERSTRPVSSVYKSSVFSYENSTRNRSRQNIMKRYDNFAK